MPSRLPGSRAEYMIIIASALAVALLFAVGIHWYLERDNRWFRIVTPPNETPAEIIAFDRSLNVYIRTRQGSFYRCGGSSWRDSCLPVSVSDLPAVRVPAQWSTCPSGLPALPAPPGVAIDSIDAGRCLEASTYSRVILLGDGTLWQWRRTYSWAGTFGAVSGVLLGLTLGAAGGAVAVKLRRYLREP